MGNINSSGQVHARAGTLQAFLDGEDDAWL